MLNVHTHTTPAPPAAEHTWKVRRPPWPPWSQWEMLLTCLFSFKADRDERNVIWAVACIFAMTTLAGYKEAFSTRRRQERTAGILDLANLS